MATENPEFGNVPVEAETAKYNSEEIKNLETRKKTAKEISENKSTTQYDTETIQGRDILSDEWIEKAKLSSDQITAIYEELGIEDSDNPTMRDQKRKDWQTKNKLKSDGILGWATLEALDKKIEEKLNVPNAQGKKRTNGPKGLELIQARSDKRMTEAEEKQKKEESKTEDKKEQLRTLTDSLSTEYEGQEVRFGEYDLVSTKFEDGTMGYEDVESGQRLNLQTGKLETEEDQQRTELATTTKDILEKNKDIKDFEFSGSKFVKDLKLGELGRGYEESNGNVQAGEEIKALEEKIKPLLAKHPKMAELTLQQYQQFLEKPESFATSDLIPDSGKKAPSPRGRNNGSQKQETVYVAPESFGLEGDGHEYARNGSAIIKKPKEGANLDNIMIANQTAGAGNFETVKQWMQRVEATPGAEYQVYGMPGLKFSKSNEGKISVYEESADRAKYEYLSGKWSEKTPSTVTAI